MTHDFCGDMMEFRIFPDVENFLRTVYVFGGILGIPVILSTFKFPCEKNKQQTTNNNEKTASFGKPTANQQPVEASSFHGGWVLQALGRNY